MNPNGGCGQKSGTRFSTPDAWYFLPRSISEFARLIFESHRTYEHLSKTAFHHRKIDQQGLGVLHRVPYRVLYRVLYRVPYRVSYRVPYRVPYRVLYMKPYMKPKIPIYRLK